MSVIEGKNLVYIYEETDEDIVAPPKAAIDHLAFSVKEGEFVGILGHNGSGKSTLAKLLNGLSVPTEGEITVFGYQTTDEDSIWEIRKLAGMVFQNPDNQIVATVVEEDVAFGPENIGVPTAEIWERVEAALKKVGMLGYRKHSPNKLSGGQKQRVAIAGVLAMRPKCIILDEATAMLDPRGRKEVLDTILSLRKETGITVIWITHYMDEVIDADRIMVMDHGKLMMEGTPQEVFRRYQELYALGLEVPTVTELSVWLREQGMKLPVAIHSDMLCKSLKQCVGQYFTVKNAGKTMPQCEKRSGQPVLSMERVTYRYSPGTGYEQTALRTVSLKIDQGDFIGIMGHTGSGKSTMIQILAGLEKPTEGIVRFEGCDIYAKEYDRRKLHGNVGIVFQYPEYQLFESSVLKDVSFGPKNQGLSDEEVLLHAQHALHQLHVEESLWDKSPLDLSGGQKRRIAIAGVLAMEPKVLILDEPTAGLDPRGRKELLTLLEEIHKERGMTILLVSHNMEDVAQYASHLIVMNHGQIALEGTPQEVFSHKATLEQIGLGLPPVTYLFEQLRESGLPLDESILTMEQGKAWLQSIWRKEDNGCFET